MRTKNSINQIITFTIFLLIVFSIFFNRYIFTKPYNLFYIQDLFHHSQWFDGTSKRIMSDNELYPYAGYRYFQGDDLFSINPEVPPFGKYLYGASLSIFGNPYFASLLLYVICLVSFYSFSKLLLKDSYKAQISVILLLISPLYFQQLSLTMLDLPLLLFFLLHLNFVLRISSSSIQSNCIYSLLAGLSLGFFSATKFPIYLPIILLIDLYFLAKKHHVKSFIIILIVTIFSYLLTFFPYFTSGKSMIDFIRSEIWTVKFYLSGKIKENIFVKIMAIIFGIIKYPQFNQLDYERIDTWNIFWPITLFISLFHLLKFKLNQTKLRFNYLSFLILSFISFFIFLNFYPRYFLLPLALGITLFVKYFSLHSKILLPVIIVSVFQFVLFLRPTTNLSINYIKKAWENGFYQDLYFLTSSPQDGSAFIQFDEKLSSKIDYPPDLVFEYQEPKLFDDKVTVNLKIYNKNNSDAKFSGQADLVRFGNSWRLVWQDQFIDL